jgi:hypothetical protein
MTLVGDRADVPPENAGHSVIVKNGATFWDWISGGHPTLKKIVIFAGIAVLVYGLYTLNPYLPVFLGCSFGLGYLIFRNMLFGDDAVRVVSLNKDRATEINFRFVGKKLFAIMTKNGNPLAFSTCQGEPIYLAEDMTDDSITFSWIHDIDRWKFITKSNAFDYVRKVADKALQQLLYLKHVPRTLGLEYAHDSSKKQDEYYDAVLKGQPIVDEILQQIADSDDPLEDNEKTANKDQEEEGLEG